MRTVGMVIARIVSVLAIIGVGYAAYDAIKTKKTKRERKAHTAPFGDTHYETVKQTFPESASDMDTPEMVAERHRIAQK